MVDIKSDKEIEIMKEACKIANMAQIAVEKAIKPGVSTKYLDQIAEKVIRDNGGIPSCIGVPGMFKWAKPFPATCCISLNDEIIHGIPSDKVILKEGNIVTVDLVAFKNGFHGDCARTYPVGNISKEARRLIEVTKQAFYEGIKYATPENKLGDICSTIEEFVVKNGYSVIKEFQGHGIGRQMHEAPDIPNYGKKGTGIRLKEGMTLAIEPMVNEGSDQIEILDDGWTVVTKDSLLSAHYENTILITKKGAEILTK